MRVIYVKYTDTIVDSVHILFSRFVPLTISELVCFVYTDTVQCVLYHRLGGSPNLLYKPMR